MMDKNEIDLEHEHNKEIMALMHEYNESCIKYLQGLSIEKVIINEPRNLQGKYTLENSILSIYVNYHEFEPLNYALCSWLEDSINIFNYFKYSIESDISHSILPEQMVKQELSNLNQFLETGVYKSKASHSAIATEELHELYSHLLFGGTWGFMGLDELCAFQDILNNQAIESKAAFFKESMQDIFKKDWYLSIRIQVLLWMKEYLEELNEKKDFTVIFSKYKRQSPFESLSITKQCFQASNPKIVPALYELLIEHGLIEDEEFDKFNRAFLKGEGSIKWKKGGNSLIYLTSKMRENSIIENTAFMKITAEIFIDRKGEPFNYGSLNTASNKNKDIPPKPSVEINSIIAKLKSIS